MGHLSRCAVETIVFSFLLLPCSISAGAQTSLALPIAAIPANDSSNYTIRRDVPEVEMPLTVVDTRHPATEITPDALRVIDNGVPVAITSVAQPSTTPIDLTVVLDVSDSLLRESTREYEAAALFAGFLRPEFDHLSVVAFSSKIEVKADVPLAGGIGDTLQSLHRGHLSAVYDAIARASEEAASHPSNRRRVIVLFTDGEDNVSRLGSSDALKSALSSGAVFYAVSIPRKKDVTPNPFLDLLCSSTSGRVITLSPKDLLTGMRQLQSFIETQYVVSFRPAAVPSRFGAWHTVAVASLVQGVQVRSRAGYVAK